MPRQISFWQGGLQISKGRNLKGSIWQYIRVGHIFMNLCLTYYRDIHLHVETFIDVCEYMDY